MTADATGSDARIPVASIRAQYGRFVALNNVSLDIFPGEIVVLMGRNGAGKTTLLKSMVGLVRPDGGTVSVMASRLPAEMWPTSAGMWAICPRIQTRCSSPTG
jgi:osmoprotectant transport system ATP-binding protein